MVMLETQGKNTGKDYHDKSQREAPKGEKGKEKMLNKQAADPSPTKAQIWDAQRKVVQEIKKTASEVLNNNKWKGMPSVKESSGKVDSESEHGEGEERPPKATPRLADEIIWKSPETHRQQVRD